MNIHGQLGDKLNASLKIIKLNANDKKPYAIYFSVMNEYLQLIVNGVCIGFGSAVGTYLAMKGFVKSFEAIVTHLRDAKDE